MACCYDSDSGCECCCDAQDVYSNIKESRWFVTNFMREIPVIGDLVTAKKFNEGATNSMRSLAAITGAVFCVIYGPLVVGQDDTLGVEFGKHSANVALGMTGGKIAYNLTASIFKLSYKALKATCGAICSIDCTDCCSRPNVNGEKRPETKKLIINQV